MNLDLTSMYLEQLCWLLNFSSTQTSLQDWPVHISDRNILFSLLLWQLFMTWFGLPPGSAFQWLCWPDSTRIINRKCLLFLGKLLWFWASEGQKAHCCQQEVVFSCSHWKYPWQVSLRSNPPFPSSFPSLDFAFWFSVQCCTMTMKNDQQTHGPALKQRMRISHTLYLWFKLKLDLLL